MITPCPQLHHTGPIRSGGGGGGVVPLPWLPSWPLVPAWAEPVSIARGKDGFAFQYHTSRSEEMLIFLGFFFLKCSDILAVVKHNLSGIKACKKLFYPLYFLCHRETLLFYSFRLYNMNVTLTT